MFGFNKPMMPKMECGLVSMSSGRSLKSVDTIVQDLLRGGYIGIDVVKRAINIREELSSYHDKVDEKNKDVIEKYLARHKGKLVPVGGCCG